VLASASPGAVDVEIDLHRADGTLLGTLPRSLQPYEYRQLNRVFEMVTGDVVDDGYAAVRTTTDGGAFFALASVVDNLTGDPVGMSAPTILSPGSEEILEEVVDVYELLGQGSFEDALDRVQDLGVDGVLDGIVSVQPDVATRTTQGLMIDYGDGYAAPGGSYRSGAVFVDTSGVSATAEGLSGTMTITHDQLMIDGEPAAIGSTAWTFDLVERGDGTVSGEITVDPIGRLKSNGSLYGIIGIDTAICLEFPISGSVTAEVEGEIITIVFRPDCDGTVDHEVEPVPGGGGGGDLLAVEWSFEGSSSLVGTVDSDTGEWSALGSSGFPRVNSMARNGTGVFYSITETGTWGGESLITIDPGTGAGSLVGEVTGLAEEHYVAGLAFSPSGTLYATVGEVDTAEPVDDLFVIDPHTGVADHVGTIDGFDGVNTLDFDDASGILYAWNYPSGLMTINPATAAGADVNPAVGGPSITALVVLPDGTMVGGQHDLYTIDRNTGVATQIAEGVLSNVRGIEVLEDR